VTSVLVRGDLVAAADVLGKLHLFRYAAKVPLASLDCHPRAISALALHPRDFLFATASEDSVINLWAMPEAAAGGSRLEHRAALKLSDHTITGLAFTNDGALAVASYDIVYLRVLRKS
jgi:WD40 repeat protein